MCLPTSGLRTRKSGRRKFCWLPPSRSFFSAVACHKAEAARQLGVDQPKVSALLNYKLEGFSVERLMCFLTALDQDVEIVIRRKPRSRRAARIVVTAA